MIDLEIFKEQQDFLTVLEKRGFELQMASFTRGCQPCKENDVNYRKAHEAFYDAIDEMRKLISRGCRLCK